MKIAKSLSFLVLFSIVSAASFAQLSFKVGAGPQYSNVSAYIVDYTGYMAFSADVRAVLRSEKKLQLELGVGFNQKGNTYNTDFRDLRWPSQHDGFGGFDPTITVESNIASIKLKDQLSFVELPIQSTFFFKAPSDGFYALASIRPSFAVAAFTIQKQFDASGREIKKAKNAHPDYAPLRRFNLLPRAGFGFEKKTESSLNYYLELFGEFQALSTYKSSTAFHRYYYGFGALLGVRF